MSPPIGAVRTATSNGTGGLETSSPLAATATSCEPLPSRYSGPTCSAICLAIPTPSSAVGVHADQPSGTVSSVDDVSIARITPSPTIARAMPISAPVTNPKRGR